MYTHRTAYSLAAILGFFTVLVGVSIHGAAGRVVATGQTLQDIDSPEKVFALWQEKKVKGRTLLLFGSYPLTRSDPDHSGVRELTLSNFIEYSAFHNIIRRIYFIIPDSAWEDIVQQRSIGAFRRVEGMERGLYLFTLIGIPIVATTTSSLPHLSEKSLVYVNNRLFDTEEVRDILAKKGITSDIFVAYHEY